MCMCAIFAFFGLTLNVKCHVLSCATRRIFNYSRTVARGAKIVMLEVDGNVVYMGDLLPADE